MKLRSNASHALIALPVLLLAAALPASEGGNGKGGGLVRVEDDAPQGERAQAMTWREALQDEDLDQRMQSFERLVEAARSDRQTRRLVEELAGSHDPELAWTARLAQRELERGSPFGAVPFGQWTPHGRTFRFQLPDRSTLGSPFGDPFGDLEERVRELERMFQGLDDVHGAQPSPLSPAHPPGASRSSTSTSIQIGPEGVKVELREEIDGEEQVRTFEGETLEEVLAAHPELRDEIGVDLSGSFPFAGTRRLPGLQGWLDRDGSSTHAGRRAQPPTNILGIEYRAPKPDEVQSLGLEAGVGLVVERTVPGTIAHLLGVERGDVLVELNGNRLFGGEDVSRVLRERLPEADVALAIVDTKGQRRTLTWRPPPREDGF